MSTLRAKCPTCKTLTAVAVGPEYECHACGRTFNAGLVRVPQAWGDGGEAMCEQQQPPSTSGRAGRLYASTRFCCCSVLSSITAASG